MAYRPNNTNTSQPCFNAYLSADATNATGDNSAYTVIFNTEINDQASNYDNTTGVFTAPVTGNYLFNTTIIFGNIGVQTGFLINLTGSAYGIVPIELGRINFGTNQVMSGTAIVHMTAGDTMSVVVYGFGSTKTVSIGGGAPASGLTATSTFSGVLLC